MGRKKTKPKMLSRDQLLTISATEYCRMVNRDLSDYWAQGVQGSDTYTISELDARGGKSIGSYYFREKCPPETEVVVDYKCQVTMSAVRNVTTSMIYNSYVMTGTALVPKSRKRGGQK